MSIPFIYTLQWDLWGAAIPFMRRFPCHKKSAHTHASNFQTEERPQKNEEERQISGLIFQPITWSTPIGSLYRIIKIAKLKAHACTCRQAAWHWIIMRIKNVRLFAPFCMGSKNEVDLRLIFFIWIKERVDRIYPCDLAKRTETIGNFVVLIVEFQAVKISLCKQTITSYRSFAYYMHNLGWCFSWRDTGVQLHNH